MVRTDDAVGDPLDRAEDAAQRIEEWRSNLLKLGTGTFQEIEEVSFLGREMRAAAVVATMAELEAILREMLVSIGAHVSSLGLKYRDLAPSLRSLAAHSDFEGLRSTRDSKKNWEARQLVTRLEDSEELVTLPKAASNSPQPPLDGRTIQSRHISLVWSVLGIENPIPSASTVASLKKLTQLRNDVAHRNLEISDVFSSPGRTAQSIAGYLDDVTLLVLHIGVEWDSYIKNRGFLHSRQSENG